MQVAKIICFLSAVGMLKYVQKYYPDYEIYAYSCLFMLAFLTGLYGVWTLYKIEDREVGICQDVGFLKQIILSLHSKSFCCLLTALSVLNFGFAFLMPFITVFMLTRLDIAMSNVLILTFVSQIAYVLVIKKLGSIDDHRGSSYILLLSVLLLMLSVLGLIAINYLDCSLGVLISILVVLHIISGCATAAFNLGINNTSLLYIPNEMAAVYLSVNSICKSAAGALGALVAGFVLTLAIFVVQKIGVPENSAQTAGWTIFFVIALLIEMLGIVLLQVLKKKVSVAN